MSKKLTLQDPGEGIHEVEIRQVLVSKGDQVSEGDPVLTVESDKAAIDIPAPYSGTVSDIAVSEGDTAQVGDVLMRFDEAEQDGSGESSPEEDEESSGSEKSAQDTAEEDTAEEDTGEEDTGEADREDGPDADDEADAQTAQTKKDERGASAQDKERQASSATQEKGEARSDEKDDAQAQAKHGDDEPEAARRRSGDDAAEKEQILASPVARKAAQEHGVALEDVEPSGPEGRVLLEDVEALVQRDNQDRETAKSDARAALPDFSQWGDVEREKLRSVRRATARRMAQSWAEIPHVTHQDEADITELERFRQRHAHEVDQRGGKLTLTAFVIKAAVAALKEYPRLNASLDAQAEEIIVKHYHHFGVAVDTPQGLLVPVIRDVDRKSILDLAVALTEVAEQAREGALSREAMQGASFTITNVGALGGTGFTPIINHPEVAILGLARAQWRPVIQAPTGEDEGKAGDRREEESSGNRISARLMLPMVLAFDHRVIDGATAARFMRHLADTLTDLESFALVG